MPLVRFDWLVEIAPTRWVERRRARRCLVVGLVQHELGRGRWIEDTERREPIEHCIAELSAADRVALTLVEHASDWAVRRLADNTRVRRRVLLLLAGRGVDIKAEEAYITCRLHLSSPAQSSCIVLFCNYSDYNLQLAWNRAIKRRSV